MVMVSKFSNFPDELSENDELREYEISESDSTQHYFRAICKEYLENEIHLNIQMRSLLQKFSYVIMDGKIFLKI